MRYAAVGFFLRDTWAQWQTLPRPRRRYQVSLLVCRESFRIRFQTMERRLRVNSWVGLGGVRGQAAQVWLAENREVEKALQRGVRQGEPTREQPLLAAPLTAPSSRGFSRFQLCSET